jgi:hypothetical protein
LLRYGVTHDLSYGLGPHDMRGLKMQNAGETKHLVHVLRKITQIKNI